MPAKATVRPSGLSKKDRAVVAAERDLAGCQHAVDRAKRAIEQQKAALKIAEAARDEAAARLEAVTEEGDEAES